MAIQSSGTITIQDIVDEFGGSTPHSLSEYYRDGANVPGNNTNVPTSGAIAISDFYGAVNEIVIALTNGATNLNASTLFGSNYTSSVPKRLTVASGVEIGATSGNNVLTIPSGMAGTLIIDNAGTISGYGGPVGQTGGNGILIEVNGVTINNSGTIRAGGGSGGTGGTGGTGGNGSATTESNFTGSSIGGCSYMSGSFQGQQWIGTCGSVGSGYFNGNQACSSAFGGQYTGAGGSGNQGYTRGQASGGSSTYGTYNWGTTISSPKYWRILGGWKFTNQGCSIVTTSSTSGGAGGAGGAGGVGQGYNQSAGSGSGGSGGSAGGTNAGTGGSGGTGGTGGAYGATGSTGATGSSGANGNASNGSSGSSGSAGSAAGYYAYYVGSVSATINNTGTLTGQAP